MPLRDNREEAAWAAEGLHVFGAVSGSERVAELTWAANRHPPDLHTHGPVRLRRSSPPSGRFDEIIALGRVVG